MTMFSFTGFFYTEAALLLRGRFGGDIGMWRSDTAGFVSNDIHGIERK